MKNLRNYIMDSVLIAVGALTYVFFAIALSGQLYAVMPRLAGAGLGGLAFGSFLTVIIASFMIVAGILNILIHANVIKSEKFAKIMTYLTIAISVIFVLGTFVMLCGWPDITEAVIIINFLLSIIVLGNSLSEVIIVRRK